MLKGKLKDNNVNEHSNFTKNLKENTSNSNVNNHSRDHINEEGKEENESIFQISIFKQEKEEITTLVDSYRTRSTENISDLELIHQNFSSIT